MLDKTQLTKVAVAGFGAALASVYAIPEAHATIIPISFNPGSIAASTQSKTITAKGTGTVGQVLSGNVANRYYHFQSTLTSSGVTTFSTRSTYGTKNIVLNQSSSLAIERLGKSIFAGSFSGKHTLNKSVFANGTEYVGFRSKTGGAGWFAVNWGGADGAIKFIKGAYNTDEGGFIKVGQMSASVPEPGELGLMALGLLALGAAGVRLRREARKAAELS